MRRLLTGLLIAGTLISPLQAGAVEKETVTLRELGEAVHVLIDLYNKNSKENENLRKEIKSLKKEVSELKEENVKLKKELKELHGKFVLLKMEEDLALKEGQKVSVRKRKKVKRRITPSRTGRENVMNVPKVEIVPGTEKNEFPWITFKRSDVECSLPKQKTDKGYVYYNVFLTTRKEKAINFAKNLARAGFCTVVRVVSREKPLYRVVVIPQEDTKEKLKEMGLKYCYYVRNLDLTKSSGGEL